MIGQAKGVLMAQHGIGSDEAFQMLREASERANIKLRDVAAKVVDGVPFG
jgi:AmiR/NasT family two-component response regulator